MSNFSQICIEYIEKQSTGSVNIRLMANRLGYSSFHFQRKFQQTFQMTINEYVRKRRLAQASYLLIHTRERVLDIALLIGFESQEAFTRAFKIVYGLPPGRYRSLLNHIRKGDMTMEVKPIKGWILAGDEPQNYEVGLDTKNVHQGKHSAYIKANTVKLNGGFVTLMQQFRAENYRGKRMKLSGFIKTKAIEDYCGLWMRVDNKQLDVLQFDNMFNRKITGDTDWNVYSVVLDIPEESEVIAFGLNLSGPGRAWLGSLSFQEVKKIVPTTNLNWHTEIQLEPQNLSFDD